MADGVFGDSGARPVELGRAMAGLAQQYHSLVRQSAEQPGKGRIIQVAHRRGRLPDGLGRVGWHGGPVGR